MHNNYTLHIIFRMSTTYSAVLGICNMLDQISLFSTDNYYTTISSSNISKPYV